MATDATPQEKALRRFLRTGDFGPGIMVRIDDGVCGPPLSKDAADRAGRMLTSTAKAIRRQCRADRAYVVAECCRLFLENGGPMAAVDAVQRVMGRPRPVGRRTPA